MLIVGIHRPAYARDWSWSMLMAVTIFCLSLILFPLSVIAQLPGSSPIKYSVENTARVGSLVFDNGQTGGSCFYCDDRGYVATCFSNIRDARTLSVQFDAKTRIAVTGFVAASRGFDVVILQLLDSSLKDDRFKRALELRPDFMPKVSDELVAWGGPLATAATPALSLPKVVQVLRGDELILSSSGLTAQSLGTRPDSCWIWLNQPRHLSCNGAPIFNQAGHTVGMLSAGSNPSMQIYSAIHIQHVIELIPKDDPKPKPIKLLKTWIDPIPLDPPQNRLATNPVDNIDSSLGGDLEYGEPLASRFGLIQARIEQARSQRESIEKSMTLKQEKQTSLLVDIETLQTQIRAVVPEEAYTVTKTKLVPREVEKTERERGPDGKMRSVKKTETVMERETEQETHYRHSARQLKQLEPIQAQLKGVQSSLEANQLQFDYETQVRLPFLVEATRQIETEFFYYADPLGLRPRAEHEAFHESLTAVIESGDATANTYLARSMTLIHLAKYKDALADLKEAYDIDTKLRPLCRALHARIQGLESSHDKAMTAIKQLLRDEPENAELRTIAARMELDNQSIPSATRYLQQALQLQPASLELQLGTSWLISQGTSNSKLALDMASSAATRTGFRDWNSLAALANAHMLRNQKELARELISIAHRQAPDSAKAWCELWQRTIESEQPIQRNWKM